MWSITWFPCLWYYSAMKVLPLENPFGARVYRIETATSTFDIARKLAEDGEAHGAVICADFQEEGRGRQKRPWLTERGKSLLFTILLRYADASSMPEALTLKTGLAVSMAIEDFAPALRGQVQIKWPNDVMICRGHAKTALKAAGILTEADGSNVFIGVGVNVAQTEFPEEYRSKAGSIAQVFPDLPNNANFILLEKILSRLYGEIESLPKQEACDWRERIIQRLYKKGEAVTFAEGAADSNRLIEGTLSGIGSGGELLIIPNGEKTARSFITGELRVY